MGRTQKCSHFLDFWGTLSFFSSQNLFTLCIMKNCLYKKLIRRQVSNNFFSASDIMEAVRGRFYFWKKMAECHWFLVLSNTSEDLPKIFNSKYHWIMKIVIWLQKGLFFLCRTQREPAGSLKQTNKHDDLGGEMFKQFLAPYDEIVDFSHLELNLGIWENRVW